MHVAQVTESQRKWADARANRRYAINAIAVTDRGINLPKVVGIRPLRKRPSVIRRKAKPLYTPGDISSRLIGIVAQEYDFLGIDLRSVSQHHKYTEARQVAMFLLYRFTRHDSTGCARKLGRSRRTAIKAFRDVRKLIETDAEFSEKYDLICDRLQDELKLNAQKLEPPKLFVASSIIQKIMEYVAGKFNILVTDLIRPLRENRYTRPRQIVYYLVRELTDEGYLELGRQLNRDHTTGISAVARIKQLMFNDAAFCQQVAELELGFADWSVANKLSANPS